MFISEPDDGGRDLSDHIRPPIDVTLPDRRPSHRLWVIEWRLPKEISELYALGTVARGAPFIVERSPVATAPCSPKEAIWDEILAIRSCEIQQRAPNSQTLRLFCFFLPETGFIKMTFYNLRYGQAAAVNDPPH